MPPVRNPKEGGLTVPVHQSSPRVGVGGLVLRSRPAPLHPTPTAVKSIKRVASPPKPNSCERLLAAMDEDGPPPHDESFWTAIEAEIDRVFGERDNDLRRGWYDER